MKFTHSSAANIFHLENLYYSLTHIITDVSNWSKGFLENSVEKHVYVVFCVVLCVLLVVLCELLLVVFVVVRCVVCIVVSCVVCIVFSCVYCC